MTELLAQGADRRGTVAALPICVGVCGEDVVEGLFQHGSDCCCYPAAPAPTPNDRGNRLRGNIKGISDLACRYAPLVQCCMDLLGAHGGDLRRGGGRQRPVLEKVECLSGLPRL